MITLKFVVYLAIISLIIVVDAASPSGFVRVTINDMMLAAQEKTAIAEGLQRQCLEDEACAYFNSKFRKHMPACRCKKMRICEMVTFYHQCIPQPNEETLRDRIRRTIEAALIRHKLGLINQARFRKHQYFPETSIANE